MLTIYSVCLLSYLKLLTWFHHWRKLPSLQSQWTTLEPKDAPLTWISRFLCCFEPEAFQLWTQNSTTKLLLKVLFKVIKYNMVAKLTKNRQFSSRPEISFVCATQLRLAAKNHRHRPSETALLIYDFSPRSFNVFLVLSQCLTYPKQSLLFLFQNELQHCHGAEMQSSKLAAPNNPAFNHAGASVCVSVTKTYLKQSVWFLGRSELRLRCHSVKILNIKLLEPQSSDFCL